MKLRALLVLAIAMFVGQQTVMAGPPPATPIYDSIGGTSDGLGFSTNVLNNEWVYDDLHVAGGGLLAGFSFAYGTEAFQGFAEGDGEIVIYLDDGATSPGTLDTNEDTLLVSESYRGLAASAGAFGAVLFERQDQLYPVPTVNIPAGATLWAGMTFTSTLGGNLHGVYFSPVSIGSSDNFTYDDNDPPFDLVNFGLPGGSGLGWELYVVPEPATAALFVIGAVAVIRRRR